MSNVIRNWVRARSRLYKPSARKPWLTVYRAHAGVGVRCVRGLVGNADGLGGDDGGRVCLRVLTEQRLAAAMWLVETASLGA